MEFNSFRSYLESVIRERYINKFLSILDNPPSRLKINFTDSDFDPRFLAGFVKDRSNDLKREFKEVLLDILLTDYNITSIQEQAVASINIYFTGLYEPTPVRLGDLNSSYLNKLVSVEGLIFQYGQSKPTIWRAGWSCRFCGEITYCDHFKLHLDKPSKCLSCGKTQFSIVEDTIEYNDTQRLLIQEPLEDLDSERKPDLLDVYVCNGHIYDFDMGLNNVFVGYLRMKEIDKKNTKQEWYLECLDIYPGKSGLDRLDLTQQDIDRIVKFSKEKDLLSKFSELIAPKIVKCDHVKNGLALQMFGGVTRKSKLNNRKRGEVHVLLLGNPGTGKSELMHSMSKFYPRSQFVSGGNVTRVGLTAAVTPVSTGKSEDVVLTPGALILADKGVCLIDEFDKIRSEDRASLHDAMEHGQVKIDKWNAHKKYDINTTILAAGNPVHNSFTNGANIKETGVEFSLRSRFDLIYLFDQSKDLDAIHDAMFKFNNGLLEQETSTLDLEFYLKYLIYARTLTPVLRSEDYEIIKKESFNLFSKIQSGSESLMVDFNARVAGAIQRLAEASARMHLSEYITIRDIQVAKKVLIDSYKTQNISVDEDVDLNLLYSGQPTETVNKLKLVSEVIGTVPEIAFMSICNLIPSIPAYELEDIVAELEDKGMIMMVKPKVYRYRG